MAVMSRKVKISLTVLCLAVLALIAFTFFFAMHDPDRAIARNQAQFQKELSNMSLGAQNPLSDQFVKELRKYYGKSIADKVTQASLYNLRNMIMGSNPEKGRALFYSMLKKAFPGYADEIMATLDKIDLYNKWLADNKDMLSRMTATERLAAMEKKRKELFGNDADKIWSGEELASESRKAKMQDTLAVLNESRDTTMDEKLEVYQGTLKEAYANTPEGFILTQGDLLSKVFFSIDSVQEELKQMNSRDRQEEINRIRKKMGFTDKQVESMAKRDADNEMRWEAGLQYMKDRDKVVEQYQGQEQEEKLKELREQYFDDEANTIELEEKGDFYRFKRPHIYGRN
jgi:hypothetical protein